MISQGSFDKPRRIQYIGGPVTEQLLKRTRQDTTTLQIKIEHDYGLAKYGENPQNSFTREALDWNPQGHSKQG